MRPKKAVTSETSYLAFWRKITWDPPRHSPRNFHIHATGAAYEGSLSACEKRNRWLSFELIPSFVLILAKSGDKILAKNDTLEFITTQNALDTSTK